MSAINIVVAIALNTAALTALHLALPCSQRKKMQIEAVERGYAEWTTDSNGTATWRWKEKTP